MSATTAGNRRVSFAAAGAGPGIVLVHAFPFSSAMWRRTADDLARDHRVVTPDLPGFGGSEAWPADDTTVARYAEAVEAAANAASPGATWTVAGLSLGGYVAFELWRRRRIPMRAVVLSSTRAEPDDEAGRAGRVTMADRVRETGAAAAAEALLPKMVTPACPPAARAQADAWMREAPVDGILGALHALMHRPDSRPDLPTIDVPALVLSADGDPITPPADHERMAAAMPRARLVRIAGAAHLACLEQPERYVAALRAWNRELG